MERCKTMWCNELPAEYDFRSHGERWQVAQQTYSLGMRVFSRVVCKDELSIRDKNKTKPGHWSWLPLSPISHWSGFTHTEVTPLNFYISPWGIPWCPQEIISHMLPDGMSFKPEIVGQQGAGGTSQVRWRRRQTGETENSYRSVFQYSEGPGLKAAMVKTASTMLQSLIFSCKSWYDPKDPKPDSLEPGDSESDLIYIFEVKQGDMFYHWKLGRKFILAILRKM